MKKILPIVTLLFILFSTPTFATFKPDKNHDSESSQGEFRNHGGFVSFLAKKHLGGPVVSLGARSEIGKHDFDGDFGEFEDWFDDDHFGGKMCSPKPSPSVSPSPDVSPSPSASPEVSPSPTPEVSPSPSPSPDVSPSPSPSVSPEPSVSPSPSASPEANTGGISADEIREQTIQRIIERLQSIIERLQGLLG